MAEDRLNLPFTGLVSFMRVPTCTDLDAVDADIAILGAPSDEGSPWKPGSRFAPRKIRELSIKYAGYGPVQHQLGYYDIDENRRFLEYERQQSRIVDCGDSDIVYTNVRKTFDNITRDVRRILDAGAFPVVIGGDHAVTYPVVRAYTERLNVVHFDAHMDYRPFVHGVQFFFSSRRRHTRYIGDWSSDVCSSDLRRPRPRATSVRSKQPSRSSATRRTRPWRSGARRSPTSVSTRPICGPVSASTTRVPSDRKSVV